MSVFRVYEEVGKDGYPPEWHKLTYDDLGIGVLTEREPGIKHLVREQARHRCVRCGHPYRKGDGEWSPCDDECFRNDYHQFGTPWTRTRWEYDGESGEGIEIVEAAWRILTVHHLNGNKADCRWWNLAALCQRCHLRIQRTVVMERVFPYEHSEWFRPYASGWYAFAYLGLDLTREEALEREDALLALERVA